MYICLNNHHISQQSHDSEAWITFLRILKYHFKKCKKSRFWIFKKKNVKNVFSNCGQQV